MGADGVRHPQGCSGRTENRRRRREVCQPQTPGNNVQPKANKLFDWAVCLALILVTVAIYWQVAGFDFVNYDDDLYVYENAHVKAGLTLDTVKWAFTAVVVGNWMPVTLLSHILDSQLFGMQSGAHHIVNVLIHALSSVFLYLFLRRATGARGASAFVAFVFALHPLHVQSVAWVAERKDVLAAFFLFLALNAYLCYTQRRSRGRYWGMAAIFCLGLMSKPTLVTFPFALLLLDWWPLRWTAWPKTIWEKLPLIALSAGASVVTYLVQSSTSSVAAIPLGARIENAIRSYVTYIRQVFWPTDLAVFYPYPPSTQAWHVAAAFAAIFTLTVAAIRARHSRPYLTVGWLWYLGTLVPMIRFVQVGLQAHADRYMYIPLLGLTVILAWGAAEIIQNCPLTRPMFATAAILSCAACAALAGRQVSYWRNTETLFRQALNVTQENWVAEDNLGLYLARSQRAAEAIPHFEAAVRIRPDFVRAHYDLGLSLLQSGYCADAVPHFRTALRLHSDYPEASSSLGQCEMALGNYADAIAQYEAAVRADPHSFYARFNLGVSLSKIPDRARQGIEQYESVLQSDPTDAGAHTTLGGLLAGLGRKEEAIAHLEAAQRLQPDAALSSMLERVEIGTR